MGRLIFQLGEPSALRQRLRRSGLRLQSRGAASATPAGFARHLFREGDFVEIGYWCGIPSSFRIKATPGMNKHRPWRLAHVVALFMPASVGAGQNVRLRYPASGRKQLKTVSYIVVIVRRPMLPLALCSLG